MVEGYVFSSKNFKRKLACLAFGVHGDERESVQKKKKIDSGSSSSTVVSGKKNGEGLGGYCGNSGGVGGFGTFNLSNCTVTMNFGKQK